MGMMAYECIHISRETDDDSLFFLSISCCHIGAGRLFRFTCWQPKITEPQSRPDDREQRMKEGRGEYRCLSGSKSVLCLCGLALESSHVNP